MTVESSYTIAISKLSELKNLLPLFQPAKRDIYHTLSKFQVIGRNSDWFIALFPHVVIGQSDYFGWFFDSHLKTALWK